MHDNVITAKSAVCAQPSETLRLGCLLAIVGGYLDAYTYLCRGHVFANAQTGNLVLLALYLAQGMVQKALPYLAPIFAFSVGVVAAEEIRRRWEAKPRRAHKWCPHWRQVSVAVEMVTLLAVALVPSGRWDPAVNVTVSLLCAMQVESFRKFHGNAFATTMCTGNLRSATELLYRAVRMRDRQLLQRSGGYLLVILSFLGGVALGTWCTSRWGTCTVALCSILLAVCFWMMRSPAQISTS